MTIADIKSLLVSVDPSVSHYFSISSQKDYTYWEETKRLPSISDDVHQEAWRFYVHRYTHLEDDPVADALFRALDADPRIAVAHTVDPIREEGIIHHIFECEGY